MLSGSMEPNIPVGSLIYVKTVEPETLRKGDVITYLVAENTVVKLKYPASLYVFKSKESHHLSLPECELVITYFCSVGSKRLFKYLVCMIYVGLRKRNVIIHSVICGFTSKSFKSVKRNNVSTLNQNVSNKDWLTTLLLCFFLGYLGIHRFYVGKTGTAIVQLITCGGCGIWTLIDFIVICMGNFTDAEGKFIKNRP